MPNTYAVRKERLRQSLVHRPAQAGLCPRGGVLVDGATGGDLVQLLVTNPKRIGHLVLLAGLQRVVKILDCILYLDLAPTISRAALDVLTDALLG